MLALDAFLLTRVFTPVAWWIERHTGRNNFRQAEWCHIASAVCFVCWTLALWIVRHHPLWFLPFCVIMAIAWAALSFQGIDVVRRRERMCDAYPQFNDFVEVGGRLSRIRLSSLALFTSVDTFLLSIDFDDLRGWMWLAAPLWYYNFPNVFAQYLMAVHRLPPQKKKERDWFWFLRPMPVPT